MPVSFSSDFIEKVLFASDIVALIQEDTDLKGSGSRWTGLCPFPEHSEKTPSFSVSGEKQVYHCFGCGKSGNIFTYLKEQRGLSFPEAVERLAEKARLPLPQSFGGRASAGRASSRRSASAAAVARADSGETDFALLKAVNEKASLFYHKTLLESKEAAPARAWLKERDFSSETVRTFRLGFSPPKGNRFLSCFQTESERRAALKSGLLGRSQRDGALYSSYRNRLIFPVFSVRGYVGGFGARSMDGSHPKYINSKDSELFKKGRELYGLHQSGKFLQAEGRALIVEGYTDFLSLWQRGFKTVAAVLGTALTKEHGALLRKRVRSVALLFDGDQAGASAAERSLLTLLSEELEVKAASLPSGMDPDEFVRAKGASALKELIDAADNLFFQILQKTAAQSEKEGRPFSYILEKTAPFLREMPDTELRSLYKNRVLDYFGSDRSLMEKALNKLLKLRRPFASFKPDSFARTPRSLGGPAGSARSSVVSRFRRAHPAKTGHAKTGPAEKGAASATADPQAGPAPARPAGSKVFSGDRAAAPRPATDRFPASRQEPSLMKILSESSMAEKLLFVLSLESQKLFRDFFSEKNRSSPRLLLIKNPDLRRIFEDMSRICRENERKFRRLPALLLNQFEDAEETLQFYRRFLPESSSSSLFSGGATSDSAGKALAGARSSVSSAKEREKERAVLFQDCLRTLERKNRKLEASRLVSDMKIKKEAGFLHLEKIFQLTKQRLRK